eukprot:1821406-Amphidinium_carterae.1
MNSVEISPQQVPQAGGVGLIAHEGTHEKIPASVSVTVALLSVPSTLGWGCLQVYLAGTA